MFSGIFNLFLYVLVCSHKSEGHHFSGRIWSIFSAKKCILVCVYILAKCC